MIFSQSQISFYINICIWFIIPFSDNQTLENIKNSWPSGQCFLLCVPVLRSLHKAVEGGSGNSHTPGASLDKGEIYPEFFR